MIPAAFSKPQEPPYVQNKRAQMDDVSKENDITYFGAGACHIFALELHRRYSYPLRLIEQESGRISHVYCVRRGQPFDVRAGKEDPRYFFLNYCGKLRDITENELVLLFTGDNWNGVKYGLWGDPDFVIKATERAKRCAANPEYAP